MFGVAAFLRELGHLMLLLFGVTQESVDYAKYQKPC